MGAEQFLTYGCFHQKLNLEYRTAAAIQRIDGIKSFRERYFTMIKIFRAVNYRDSVISL
jgi:hypothetical protein